MRRRIEYDDRFFGKAYTTTLGPRDKLRLLEKARDYTQSLLDGKPHGECGGCGSPIGKTEHAIFVQSWILPILCQLAAVQEDEVRRARERRTSKGRRR